MKVTETYLEESIKGLTPDRVLQLKSITHILSGSAQQRYPSLQDVQHNTAISAFLKLQGQFPWAQPTSNPEEHLTPRHTGLNPFRFHIIRKNCITMCTFPALSIMRHGCQLFISLPNFKHLA